MLIAVTMAMAVAPPKMNAALVSRYEKTTIAAIALAGVR